eukprot:Phypoly_transcript_16755.p1 GENE.Phypoly_transcript_16755~~Phypoly_transcript_16755.p1  ORF type:complete len:118 (+),score=22.30 Phypoly_transcript_16755:11-364(+)
MSFTSHVSKGSTPHPSLVYHQNHQNHQVAPHTTATHSLTTSPFPVQTSMQQATSSISNPQIHTSTTDPQAQPRKKDKHKDKYQSTALALPAKFCSFLVKMCWVPKGCKGTINTYSSQ